MRYDTLPPAPGVACPDCGAAVAVGTPACPSCRLPLRGPWAERLWAVDQELDRLGRHAHRLEAERVHLLALLRRERTAARPHPATAPPGAGARTPGRDLGDTPAAAGAGDGHGTGEAPRTPGTAVPAHAGGEARTHSRPRAGSGAHPADAAAVGTGAPGANAAARPSEAAAPRFELSRHSVRNLLLMLGGALLAVAAVVFTVVSWGQLGIGARAAVLGGLTLLVGFLPLPLHRRGLTATAEAVAALALLLVLLDAYAVWAVFDLNVPPLPYAAGVAAAVAAGWACYPALVPLRGPRIAALLLAQLPALLLAFERPSAAAFALALAATAVLDAVVAARAARRSARAAAGPAGPLAAAVTATAETAADLLALFGIRVGATDAAGPGGARPAPRPDGSARTDRPGPTGRPAGPGGTASPAAATATPDDTPAANGPTARSRTHGAGVGTGSSPAHRPAERPRSVADATGAAATAPPGGAYGAGAPAAPGVPTPAMAAPDAAPSALGSIGLLAAVLGASAWASAALLALVGTVAVATAPGGAWAGPAWLLAAVLLAVAARARYDLLPPAAERVVGSAAAVPAGTAAVVALVAGWAGPGIGPVLALAACGPVAAAFGRFGPAGRRGAGTAAALAVVGLSALTALPLLLGLPAVYLLPAAVPWAGMPAAVPDLLGLGTDWRAALAAALAASVAGGGLALGRWAPRYAHRVWLLGGALTALAGISLAGDYRALLLAAALLAVAAWPAASLAGERLGVAAAAAALGCTAAACCVALADPSASTALAAALLAVTAGCALAPGRAGSGPARCAAAGVAVPAAGALAACLALRAGLPPALAAFAVIGTAAVAVAGLAAAHWAAGRIGRAQADPADERQDQASRATRTTTAPQAGSPQDPKPAAAAPAASPRTEPPHDQTPATETPRAVLRRRQGVAVLAAAAVLVGVGVLMTVPYRDATALALVCGAALAALAAWRPLGAEAPGAAPAARGLSLAAALGAAAAPLLLLDQLAAVLVGPFAWLFAPWSGPPGGTAAALPPLGFVAPSPLLLPVLAGATAVAAGAVLPLRRGAAAVVGGTGLAVLVVPVALVALDGPYALSLAVQAAVAVAVTLWSALAADRTAARVLALVGGYLGAAVAAWALTGRVATLLVLAVLAAGVAAAALLARDGRSPAPVPAALAARAVLTAGLAATVGALVAGVPEAWLPFVPLAAAAAAFAAARVPVSARRLGSRATGMAAGAAVLVLFASVVAGFGYGPFSLVAACAGAVFVGAAWGARGPWARAAVLAGTAALGLAAALVALPLLYVYAGPYGWIAAPWSGLPASGGATPLAPGGPSPHPGGAVPVATVVCASLLALARGAGGPAGRARVHTAAGVLAPFLLLPYGAAAELPYPAALAWCLVVCAVPAALAVRAADPRTARIAGAAALYPASLAAAWSLTAPSATVTVLAALFALAIAVAVLSQDTVLSAGAAAAAVLVAGGVAVAGALAAGAPPPLAAFAALAVAGAAMGAAAVPALPERTVPAVEAAAAVLAVFAALATLDRPELFSLACAVAGVIALATGLREDRRAAGYVGAALLLVALWLRLAHLEVAVPEPYTLPPAALALLVGFLHRRGVPRPLRPHSWLGYGPGLGLALLPSLAMVGLADEGPLRPLLLGAAALAVTLLGARSQLQAPLLLGGGVLALTAAHQLVPPLVAWTAAAPPWIPAAAAGAVLLVLGATYERRLRQLKRLRERIAALR
ncbi:SCO7613 C-terminal domain-containing membrane protein [Allonocardiopsis opalescens]|uniref:Uncharacterized protein n=1 Tax=Allonocardiopsis opalescens TaxID=1144618 RepID=A0A2T0QDD4_9ACTN|nr:hypothetical protein [Allonocardiopsis opalescens]PRY01902.1 hypothetical protein CLV72_101500 [Allonocardiopsis opalescens]